MEKLSREFKNLIQHLTKSMHSNLRVWKNLKRCLKNECFISLFGVDEVSNQVWAPAKMEFKLDIPLSENNGILGISGEDINFTRIYSNLDPP